jgi:hypothetical protein
MVYKGFDHYAFLSQMLEPKRKKRKRVAPFDPEDREFLAVQFPRSIPEKEPIYQSMLKQKLSNEDYMRLGLKYDNNKMVDCIRAMYRTNRRKCERSMQRAKRKSSPVDE